ncbi:Methicillin resistance mecR1 protein [Polystyrenella longa]|uniref:Methicillin resistance mecR1 protein n=1 Tax=Polystyrenella longa TaxID=2528007 RepID=A0A518CGI2_9PLAN|nr:M56 family metallopeptidase [Polystyrenella longa]QDU78330.1 Methicillin resistance mecR1 protein [Polystyrenella longa]
MSLIDWYSQTVMLDSETEFWLVLLSKVTLLLAAAWLLRLLVSKANPRYAVFVWRSLAASLCLLLLWSFSFPSVKIPLPVLSSQEPEIIIEEIPPVVPMAEENITSITFDRAPVPFQKPFQEIEATEDRDLSTRIVNTIEPEENAEPPSFAPIVEPTIEDAASISIGSLLWSIWMMVTGLLILRLSLGLYRLRILVRASSVAPSEIRSEVDRLREKLGVRSPIDVRLSTEVSIPLLTGIVRSVVLLPADLNQPENASHLPAILAHELSHARSYDVLWSRLVHLIQILFWFHPLAWKIGDVHQHDCERVCDAVATDCINDVTAYSRTLATIALRATSRPLLGTVSMARTCEVRQRIAKLQQKVFAHSLPLLAVCAMSTVALVTAVLLTGGELTEAAMEVEEAPKVVENEEPKDTVSQIKVVDEQGEVVPEGVVSITGRAKSGKYVKEDHPIVNGVAQFDLGEELFNDFKIKVQSKGYQTLTMNRGDLAGRDAYQVESEYVLDLQPAITIGGQAVDEEGQPLSNVLIRCGVSLRYRGEEKRTYDNPEGWVLTNEKGHWEAHDLPPDLKGLRLGVGHFTHEYLPAAEDQYRIYTVPEEKYDLFRQQKFELTMTEAIPLTGVVKSTEGEPIEGVLVDISGRTGNWERILAKGQKFKTNEKGEFSLPNPTRGSQYMSFEHPNWQPRQIHLNIPRREPLEVQLKSGRQVEFQIVNPEGEPLEGVNFFVGGQTYKTNAEGKWIWTNAPAGILQPQISLDGYLSPNYRPGWDTSGEPIVIMLERSIPVHMNVLDAESGTPIEKFELFLGMHIKANSPGSWEWHPHYLFLKNKDREPLLSGEFFSEIRSRISLYQYRVDAEGYLPTLSEIVDPEEMIGREINWTLKLEKNKSLIRQVFTPTGTPAANADIIIRFLGSDDLNGVIRVSQSEMPDLEVKSSQDELHLKADAEGKVTIPETDEPYFCLVRHDTGYLPVYIDVDLIHQRELNLRPWKPIKGKVLLSGKPAEDLYVRTTKTLDRSAEEGRFMGGASGSQVRFLHELSTDEEGAFSVPKMPEGKTLFKISSGLPAEGDINGVERKKTPPTWSLNVVYDPDDPRHNPFVLGDDEVDIRGQALLPPGMNLSVTNSYVRINRIRNDDEPEYLFYHNAKALLDSKGTFQLRNLSPGTYVGSLKIVREEDVQEGVTRRSSHYAKFNITPDMFTGHGPGNPIDLGEIELTENNKQAIKETSETIETETKPVVEDEKSNPQKSKSKNVVEYRVQDELGIPIEGVSFRYGPLIAGKTNEKGVMQVERSKGLRYEVEKKGYHSVHLRKQHELNDSPVAVMLLRARAVVGNVYDAETEKPIEKFRLARGVQTVDNENTKWDWNYRQHFSTSDDPPGFFSDKLTDVHSPVQYLIEADGYLPQRSAILEHDKLETLPHHLEFKLRPKRDLVWKIYTPDGEPADGAEFTLKNNLDRRHEFVFIENGKPIEDESSHPTLSVVADAQGKFEVPESPGRFLCVITHETGFLQLTDIEFYEQQELRLKPWRNINGKVLVEGKPVSGVKISTNYTYSRRSGLMILGGDIPNVLYRQFTETDENGDYELPAGPYYRCRLEVEKVSESSSEENSTQRGIFLQRVVPEWSAYYEIESKDRETVIFNIGDDEVDLVGKVSFPENMHVDLDHSIVSLTREKSEMSFHPYFRGSFQARLAADGSFRCHNLTPGEYIGAVFVGDINEKEFSSPLPILSIRVKKTLTGKFTITPDMFNGHGPDKPIDLGEIELTPVK